MALTQYTADTDIIETLGTNPEDRPTLTDNTFKAKFDENAANIKAFLNAMIAELLSTANGKGASQIGIEDSGSNFTAATVEAALAESATLISTVSGNLTTHQADLITDSDGAHGLKIESGAWTPTLIGTTTPGTHTYSAQNEGVYQKIGKRVFVQGRLSVTTKDASMAGDAQIGGLPFTSLSGYCGGVGSVANFQGIMLTAGYFVPNIKVVPNASQIAVGKSATAAPAVNVTASEVVSGLLIDFSAVYLTA